MQTPVRIQRKRTKGWKTPENTVSVCRPTKFGNPLKLVGDIIYIDAGYRRKLLNKWVVLREASDIDDLLYLYRHIIQGTQFQDTDLQYWSDFYKKIDFKILKGKNLACFCSLDKPCHADVLLKIANE